MSETKLPQCVMFDLGGVIIDVDMGSVVSGLSAGSVDTSLAEAWYATAAIDEFEKGKISTSQFGRAMVAELGLDCSAEQFMDRFLNCNRGLFPGAENLLDRLSALTHVACFSNTNEVHWASLCDELKIDKYFATKILSFELGERKPGLAAYNSAAKCLPFPPQEVVFFDDRPENVATAKQAGFDAHRVYGPEAVMEILGTFGLESEDG
ncbi:MAG: HAD-IA family hydrolase [Rhodospirillales bacterium]|nr:HAD-IA family hydrolase [Rhodospirillales bacterium]